VRSSLFGALALSLALAGCGGGAASGASQPQRLVPDNALAGSLLSADELNTIMGTSGMTPHAPVSQMGDHRNLLPNLNCLGVWQVNEAPIYESSHWKSVRQQLVRVPDSDQWNFMVVQSAVSYRTADAAQGFFTESTDRWSKCTNHNVNIQLNGQALPGWRSGDLTKTDNQLAMPYTRTSGDQSWSCQRTLSLVANLILDVQACKPQQQSAITSAVDVAAKIESKLPK
jgi:PknH-like protein